MTEAKKGQIKSSSIKHREENVDSEPPKPCLVCNDKTHDLEDCITFLTKELKERRQLTIDRKLCFACLQPTARNHFARICTQKRLCLTCGGSHPTSLHDPEKENKRISAGATHHSSNKGNVISLCIVPVYLSHINHPGKEVLCYEMLDNDCTGCLALPSMLKALAPDELRKAHVTVETVNGSTEEDDAEALDGLTIRGLGDRSTATSINLPTTFSSKLIPASRDQIPTPDNTNHWGHLKSVSQALPEYLSTIPIGLIIGGNCPKSNEPLEAVPSKDGGPFVYMSHLGCCMVGPIASSRCNNDVPIMCNRV